jgi:flagellin
MIIEHNMMAINAININKKQSKRLAGRVEKLSSGLKINRAGDNAAGLAVSQKMRAQAAGLTQAITNAEDGISMVQTFEGALQESHAILNRVKHLAVQAANGIYDNATDRAAIELEYEQLTHELNDIAATDFNGKMLLNGSENWEATAMDTFSLIPRRSSAPDDETDFLLIQSVGGGENLYSSLIAGERTEFLEFSTDWLSEGISMYNRENVVKTVIYIDARDYQTLSDNLSAKNFRMRGTKDSEIALQVGARTKDLKAFELNYDDVWKFAGGDAAAVAKAQKDSIGDLLPDTILTATALGLTVSTYAGAHRDSVGKMDMVNLSTQIDANRSIDTIDKAVNKVSLVRAKLGAVQNRLEHKVNNLNVTNENITSSESRIRDTNIADELLALTSAKILTQTSQTMLIQANQIPQNVLSLLQ